MHRLRLSVFITSLVALLPRPVLAQAAAEAADEESADEAAASEKEAPAAPAPAAPAPAPKPPAGREAQAAAEEEGMDEADLEEGPSPSRPAPQGKGVVWGVVTDSVDGQGAIEATVTVVGTKYKAITDMDGRFRLELPPGTYKLRFYYELHRPMRFDDVKVKVGQVQQLDARLEIQEDAIDTVEIETEVTRATIEGEILTRQRAAAVGDSVGRVEIAKTPDRNAAQAAQRVVGATIVGGRFVYVRGLGERYTNALLNGSPLPSPEPDRAAIPLDLFPTLVLDSITIAKSFTPDSPGDFAGGSVRIETREIPSKFLFQVSATGGYNTQSTFRDRLTYPGGSLDWLGLDDGSRALPADFPKGRVVSGGDLSDEQINDAGKSINSYFHTSTGGTPPDHSLNVVAGNGWKLGGEKKLGVLGAINYGRTYLVEREEVYNEYGVGGDGGIAPLTSRHVVRGSKNVTWGGFGSLSYRFSADHKLTLLGLHTQISDNGVTIAEGLSSSRNNRFHDTSLSFVTRGLDMLQLSGEHHFGSANKRELDWAAWVSRATREEPDTRSVAFARSGTDGDYALVDDNYSGRHFWSDQSERGIGGKADFTQPLSKKDDSKLKLGFLLNQRDRDFNARTLALRPSGDGPLRDRIAATSCAGKFDDCADDIFTSDNIGPILRPLESTRPEDAYKAKLGVYAGYVMTDFYLAKPVRVILGERLEITRQTIDPFNQFDPSDVQPRGEVNGTDLLPSLSLVLETSKRTKVRGSLTRTLARPQLRELAPFGYSDFFGGRFVSGNPKLKLTHITNADVRFEFFPTLREVLAVSGFFKRFEDPIETITISSGDRGTVTFSNAKAGTLFGTELEARKSFDFLSQSLKDFSLIANLTLATSRVELAEDSSISLTNKTRSMINQAPFVLNLSADYTTAGGTTARVLYNVVGSRIVEVGTEGLPDAYEHPRHRLDVTVSQDLGKSFQVKLVAKNLLNSQLKVTQGPDGSAPVVRRLTDGALFALTLTYTY